MKGSDVQIEGFDHVTKVASARDRPTDKIEDVW